MDTNINRDRRYIHPKCTDYLKLLDAPWQEFHLLLQLHLQVKKVKTNESDWGGLQSEILCPCCGTWTWVEVKVPIRVGGVSRLPPADWQSDLGMGDIWFLGGRARGGWGWGQLVVKPSAVREQTDGGSNVTQRCTVMCVRSLRGGKSSSAVPEACCNYFCYSIFGVIDIVLWVGLGLDRSRI